MQTNALYYGENLEILRRYIDSDSIDLVYLDPPFNSQRDYNVIFRDESGRKSDAQMLAFEDTWHWGPGAEEAYRYLTNTALHRGSVPDAVSAIIGALRKGIGTNQMMAYLVEMTTRLVELRRVLKPTGTLYLHCDPTASSYLRLVLDAIFSPERFLAEIVWKRTTTHSDAKKWSPDADRLLVYSKTGEFTFNPIYAADNTDYTDSEYRFKDDDGRVFALGDIASPNPRPNLMYEWHGYKPPAKGWRFSLETMEKLDAEGRIFHRGPDKRPRVKRYLDEMKGTRIGAVWTDLPNVHPWSAERLGYPTQKPLALLERVIEASSNPGDLVLDPFCGCGTALVAAQKLGRSWIGIDITYLSIAVMRARLKKSFPELAEIDIVGQPTEVAGARSLAEGPNGRYQFQFWALDLIYAEPRGGVEKKGADRGIDGIITFTDAQNEIQSVLVSVKSGHVTSSMVRDLKGTMEREGAAMGVFVTLEEATKEMLTEASTAGLYHSDLWNRDYPKIQVLTIRELLEERKKADLPPFVVSTYKQATKMKGGPDAVQPSVWDQPQAKVE